MDRTVEALCKEHLAKIESDLGEIIARLAGEVSKGGGTDELVCHIGSLSKALATINVVRLD